MCQKEHWPAGLLPSSVGDKRFVSHYQSIREASDPAKALQDLADEEVVQALAAASEWRDRYLANVLATEAMNRMSRSRAITNHLAEGAFAVDKTMTITFVNPTMARLLGGDWRDYAGRHLEEAIQMRDMGGRVVTQTPDCPIRQSLAEGKTREWDGDVAGMGGAPLPASFHVAPILRDGEVEGVVAAFRDVTSRRQDLHTLRESEQRFRSIIDEHPRAIFSIDASGTLTRVNPAAERLIGHPRDELLGSTFLPYLPEHEWERALANLADVLDGNSRTDDYDALRAGDEHLRLRVTGVPIRVEGGVVGAYCIAEDLTRQEGRARARERQHAVVSALGLRALAGEPLAHIFAEAVEQLKDVLDVEYTKILELDPGGRTLTLRAGRGWRPGIVPGVATVSAGSGSQAGYTLSVQAPVIVRDLREEKRFDGPPLLRDHDVRSGMSVVILGAQGPWGVLGVHTTRLRAFDDDDVDFLQSVANVLASAIQRRAAEDELEERVRERTAELQSALRDLDTFASTVSHDLRGPLRGIGYLAEELRTGVATEEARHVAERIEAEVARATHLVHDLIAFSRSRNAPLRFEDVDLAALARDVAHGVEREHPGVEREWRIHDTSVLRADPRLLRIALHNLLENAARYTRSTAKPRIDITMRDEGDERVITIADNGIGFDQQLASKLFEPFQRLPDASAHEGMGLGLATVRQIVERHGGRAWAEGEPGKGARFHIALPR